MNNSYTKPDEDDELKMDCSLVDDGYSCLKRCHPNDPVCISNHTREILYQFRGLPSTKYIKYPIEVSRNFIKHIFQL